MLPPGARGMPLRSTPQPAPEPRWLRLREHCWEALPVGISTGTSENRPSQPYQKGTLAVQKGTLAVEKWAWAPGESHNAVTPSNGMGFQRLRGAGALRA